MKSASIKDNLKNKTAEELKQVLISLLQEQFNLRMQKCLQDAPKPHSFKNVRCNIARVKTKIQEIELRAKR